MWSRYLLSCSSFDSIFSAIFTSNFFDRFEKVKNKTSDIKILSYRNQIILIDFFLLFFFQDIRESCMTMYIEKGKVHSIIYLSITYDA